jgi:hypothetical protein
LLRVNYFGILTLIVMCLVEPEGVGVTLDWVGTSGGSDVLWSKLYWVGKSGGSESQNGSEGCSTVHVGE